LVGEKAHEFSGLLLSVSFVVVSRAEFDGNRKAVAEDLTKVVGKTVQLIQGEFRARCKTNRESPVRLLNDLIALNREPAQELPDDYCGFTGAVGKMNVRQASTLGELQERTG
jgi:hypothetical protein